MFLAGYWYVEQVTNWSPPLFPIYTRCSMACWRTATFCSLDLITSSRFIICISKSDYSYANNLASQVVTMSNTAKCSFHFSRWNESHSGGSHYFCGAYVLPSDLWFCKQIPLVIWTGNSISGEVPSLIPRLSPCSVLYFVRVRGESGNEARKYHTVSYNRPIFLHQYKEVSNKNLG